MELTSAKNKPDDLRPADGNELENKFMKNDLKTIWGSLFKPDLYESFNEKDPTVLGALMLLHTAIETVKQVGSRCTSLLVSYNSSCQELEERNTECAQLKDSIRSLKNSPCGKCSILKSQLKEANKKAEEAQTRMNSIARILSLGEDKHSQGGDKCANTANLVTQMLLGTSESPKRKKRLTLNQARKKDEEEILVPETVPSFSWNEKGPGLEVPETVCDDPVQKSPLEKNPSQTSKPHDATNKPEEWSAEKKRFSNSVNIPPCNRKECQVPKKNLTTDFDKCGKENRDSPKKHLDFELKVPWKEKTAGVETTESSPQEWIRHNNSELDRIWFNEDGTPKREEKGKETREKGKFWKLKESRGSASREAVQGTRKRLKQMTLGVGVKDKKKDISKMEGFAGGNTYNSESTSQDDEVDIVLPSPKGKVRGLKKKKQPRPDTVDLSLFVPLATSTQAKTGCQDDSFDRIPSKKKESPNYKYKRDAVRGKEERAKLEGKQCEECEEYYKTVGLAPAELQNRLNSCSRHRDRYTRPKSPPGFWDPVMPDSQEFRDKGFYTTIIHTRETKK